MRSFGIVSIRIFFFFSSSSSIMCMIWNGRRRIGRTKINSVTAVCADGGSGSYHLCQGRLEVIVITIVVVVVASRHWFYRSKHGRFDDFHFTRSWWMGHDVVDDRWVIVVLVFIRVG